MGRAQHVMSKLGWLTPDSLPANYRCALLAVPDDLDFYAMLKGAIVPLFDSRNFEMIGVVTEDEAAAYWRQWDYDQNWIVPWNPYTIKLLRLYSAGLVAYWPLWDALGTTQARDYGPLAGRAPVLGAVTFDSAGIGDGMTSLYVNVAGEYVNIYSAALAGAFNPDEGSMMIWGNADNWTAVLNQFMLSLGTSAGGYHLSLYEVFGSSVFQRTAPGSGTSVIWGGPLAAGQHQFVGTWSVAANRCELYIDGVFRNFTIAGASWAGALINAGRIGQKFNTADRIVGKLAHAAIWNRVLTPIEVAQLAII